MAAEHFFNGTSLVQENYDAGSSYNNYLSDNFLSEFLDTGTNYSHENDNHLQAKSFQIALQPIQDSNTSQENLIEFPDIVPNSQFFCRWESCSLMFSNLSCLVNHIEINHIKSQDVYICRWQNCIRQMKPFDQRYKLKNHMRIHSGEKPFHCQIPGCPKSFSRQENLKIHVRTHNGERPYICQYPGCQKSFNNSSDRSKHSRTHFIARPWTCKYPWCNKRYTDPSSLRKHNRVHHENLSHGPSPSTSGSNHSSTIKLPKTSRSGSFTSTISSTTVSSLENTFEVTNDHQINIYKNAFNSTSVDPQLFGNMATNRQMYDNNQIYGINETNNNNNNNLDLGSSINDWFMIDDNHVENYKQYNYINF